MDYALLHCYSDDNRGDAGIISATVDLIKQNDTHAKIVAVSVFHNKDYRFKHSHPFTSKEVDQILPSLFPSIDYQFSKHRKASNIIKSALFVYYLIRYLIICIAPYNVIALLVGFNAEERNTLAVFKNTDKFVSKGGSFLYSFKGIKGTMFSCRMLLQFLLPLRLKKEVYIFSQSLGPFENFIPKRLFFYFSKRLKHIFIREKECLRYFNGRLNNYTVIPDAAFALKKDNSFTNGSELIAKLDGIKSLIVGITARPHFINEKSGAKKYMQYIDAFVQHLKYLIREHNASIIVVPQVIGPSENEDDRNALKLILSQFTKQEISRHFVEIGDKYSPRQLKSIYSKLDFLIGTRLHSCIFSLSENVPCVNISYHGTKSQGIMADLGLENQVILIDNISAEKLNTSAASIIKNKVAYIERMEIKNKDYLTALDNAMQRLIEGNKT